MMGYIGPLQTLYKQDSCRLQSCTNLLRKQMVSPRSRMWRNRPFSPKLRCCSREIEADFVQHPKQVEETENNQIGELTKHVEDNLEQTQLIDFSFTPEQLREQARRLDELSEVWRQERLQEEKEANRKFGFTPFAETLNGRLAMFFLVVGLLTEYWTDFTIPDQIEYILEILGFK
ncbi:hypothetical protein GpartN1_g1161.t1 [Galdieria partita]|uniref:High light inducible protein n=1 Tax=Galdieria partita TaxID=83374 RepID=A0A9C7UNC8_9RHOD|nr:hypothetical protein GpartN1_g1161.t1 [Galdieria partita]